MSGFRVIMTVTEEVSPELYVALMGVPSRLRAERVRTLAAIGLTAVSGAASLPRSAVHSHEPPLKEKATPSGSDRAVNFAKSLVGGV